MKKVLSMALILLVLFSYHNGDLNHDGKITTTDLVLMRQMVDGVLKPSISADLNYDGLINQTDLNMMRYKLAN